MSMPKYPDLVVTLIFRDAVLKTDYDALRRYAEGLEKDAERYRALRTGKLSCLGVYEGYPSMDCGLGLIHGSELDKEVDAAKGAERE